MMERFLFKALVKQNTGWGTKEMKKEELINNLIQKEITATREAKTKLIYKLAEAIANDEKEYKQYRISYQINELDAYLMELEEVQEKRG